MVSGLGSPTVMQTPSREMRCDCLDCSFAPLPFDRFALSSQQYEPRQPDRHAAVIAV